MPLRPFRISPVLPLAPLFAILLAAAAPVRRDPTELPADPGEVREALRERLSERLPGGWRVSLPQDNLGVQQVTVQVPDAWRGNPTAAAVALCPDPDSPVWQGLPLLRLVVHYHGRDWPSYDCRP